jgi:DNA repair exonuclease SbcCD ATPase subunit
VAVVGNGAESSLFFCPDFRQAENHLSFLLKTENCLPMPLYSKEEIKTKIEALEAQIAKAESQQAYTSGGPGDGMHSQRGDLRAMYQQLQFWLKEYERLEAADQSGATNLVQFGRPK